MKKLLLLSLPFVLVGLAPADGGLAFVKMSKSSSSSYVTSLKIGELTRVAGTNLTLPVYSFAGVGARNTPILGLALTAEYRIASQVTLTAGPCVALTNGMPTDVGIYAGLTWRF